MIKSRYLSTRAVFESKKIVKDSFGEEEETFNPVFTKYVDLKPVSIDKQQEDYANYNVSRLEMNTRYSRDIEQRIKVGDRVLIKGKYYLIEEVGNLLTRKMLTYTIVAYE